MIAFLDQIYEHKYLNTTKVTAPLGIRMKEHIEGCDIQLHQNK